MQCLVQNLDPAIWVLAERRGLQQLPAKFRKYLAGLLRVVFVVKSGGLELACFPLTL